MKTVAHSHTFYFSVYKIFATHTEPPKQLKCCNHYSLEYSVALLKMKGSTLHGWLSTCNFRSAIKTNDSSLLWVESCHEGLFLN